jgi:hypothetical protein
MSEEKRCKNGIKYILDDSYRSIALHQTELQHPTTSYLQIVSLNMFKMADIQSTNKEFRALLGKFVRTLHSKYDVNITPRPSKTEKENVGLETEIKTIHNKTTNLDIEVISLTFRITRTPANDCPVPSPKDPYRRKSSTQEQRTP